MDAQRKEWLGSIMVAAPLSRWILSGLALALVTMILLFLTLGHYTRRESVMGQLVPSEGLLSLSATNAGIVTHIWVHDGQTVVRGEPLVEVSSDEDSAALGNTRALIGQELDAQRLRLQADLQTQAQLRTQQAEGLKDKAALLRAQSAQIDDQLAIQKKQVESSEQLLDRIRPLGKLGYVSAFQIQQQQTTVLDAQTQYKVLLRQLLDTHQQLDDVEQQVNQLPLNAETKRNEIERQLADVGQSLARNEAQRAVVIRAPRDGIVTAVLLKEGQTLTSGQTVLSLLPSGSTLQAQLLVPSRAVGFVGPGDRVVLRYEAFPYQKFGQQYGRIADVSRSALTSSEVEMLIGQSSREPLYHVLVELDHQQVMAYGKPETLKPGMVVNADILMERRTLLEWVFEPLYGIAHPMLGGDHG